MTNEINITVNFEVKHNQRTGSVGKPMMIKVGKEIFKAYSEAKQKDLVVYVTDSNRQVTYWEVEKSLEPNCYDYRIDCIFSEGETDDGREMVNTIYVDWMDEENKDNLNWTGAQIEHTKW